MNSVCCCPRCIGHAVQALLGAFLVADGHTAALAFLQVRIQL